MLVVQLLRVVFMRQAVEEIYSLTKAQRRCQNSAVFILLIQWHQWEFWTGDWLWVLPDVFWVHQDGEGLV